MRRILPDLDRYAAAAALLRGAGRPGLHGYRHGAAQACQRDIAALTATPVPGF